MKNRYNKSLLFLIVLFAGINSLSAQKEFNNWYFGHNAGLDFNSGSPVALTNGQLNTAEGSASISDNNGSLLFYTDGISVWNRLHVVMPNGTGLLGDQTSTQSAMIVQLPGSSNLYYIFTTAGVGSGPFCYSIVDMSLAGGMGNVTTKNFVLYSTTTEKQTYAKDFNGIDYWIISHFSTTDEFYVYHLTASGVNAVPVISHAGSVITGGNYQGMIKASPQADKLAMTMEFNFTYELFDFNNSTGVVSNGGVLSNPTGVYTYGCEFSPNGKLFYGITDPAASIAGIYQYDLTAGSIAAINASATLIGSGITSFYFGSMQIGPDDKIYVARENQAHIGAINNPDVTGIACNYIDTAVFLAGKSSSLGLPNYISGVVTVSFLHTCLGDTTAFTIFNSSGLWGVTWNFDDVPSGINNTSTILNPTHVFTSPGLYNVELIKYYPAGIDTLLLPVTIDSIPVFDLGPDTTFCTGASLLLDPGAGYSSYLWQDSSSASTFSVTIAGIYSVTVSNGGCKASDSITAFVTICNAPFVSFASSDTNHCEKTCMDFFDLSTNNPTSWQWHFSGGIPDTSSLQNPATICFNSYGSFNVQLIGCNANGCDSLTLFNFINIYQSPPPPVVIQSNDTLICITPAAGYQWYMDTMLITGATQPWYLPMQGGLFYVIVTDSNLCDAASNSILITSVPLTDVSGLQLSIIPNPNNGNFQFTIHSKSQIMNLKSQIINVLGEIIFEKDFENVNGKFSQQINLSDKAKGIYILKVISDDKIFIKKFVIN